MLSVKGTKDLLGRIRPKIAGSHAQISLLRRSREGQFSAKHPPLFRSENHKFYEMVICCHGPMIVAASDKVHRLNAGDAMVIEPGGLAL